MDITELYFKIDQIIIEATQQGESELMQKLKDAQLQLEESGPLVWDAAVNDAIDWWLLKGKSNAIASAALLVTKELAINKARHKSLNKLILFAFFSVLVIGVLYYAIR
jgi:hypothetical protein